MMRDRFINHHGLDNLIWVWSMDKPYGDWYPGNDKVDIVGIDSYPGGYNYDCQKGKYNDLGNMVGWQKVMALTEVGPIPDTWSCFEQGATWLYWESWVDLIWSQNDWNHIKAVYNDWHTINEQ